MVSIKELAFFALATGLASVNAQSTGKTTRYWDCCKGSCGWTAKAVVSSPIQSCDKSDNPIADMAAKSGCESGGQAYMCTGQSPWAVDDNLAYGYAAVKLAGGSEDSWCCACYELTFTSGPVSGKKMIVQATNTGGDLGENHFDLAMPGGGVGIFNGCTAQFGAPSSGWGQQYGGISQRSDCDSFPEKLKAGCYWRFDWFKNADNPDVSFKKVTCPAVLTKKTGCTRQDEVGSQAEEPPASAPSSLVPKPKPNAPADPPKKEEANSPAPVNPPQTPANPPAPVNPPKKEGNSPAPVSPPANPETPSKAPGGNTCHRRRARH